MNHRTDATSGEIKKEFRGNVYVSPEEGLPDPRPTQDLIGKSIVSRSDGQKVGDVSDVIIDRDSLQIAAIAISKGGFFNREITAVPADQVSIWGKDVILVDHSEVVRKEDQIPGRDKWLHVSSDIRGRSVVSVDGTRIGQISDVVVDSQGRIVGYDLSQVYVSGPLAKSKRIPSTATHALGKDVLIVNTIQGLNEDS
jgi:uncharacterized protein YrrD